MSHHHENENNENDSTICFRDTRRSNRKFQTSDSLRSNFERRRDTKDGVFWFSDTKKIKQQLQLHQSQATSFDRVLPENRNTSEFANAVPYSIGRHRRWELLDAMNDDRQVTVHASDRHYELPSNEGSIFQALATREKRLKAEQHERKLKRKARLVKQNNNGSTIIEVKSRKGMQTLQLRRPGKRGINHERQTISGLIHRSRSIYDTAFHVFVFRPSERIRQRKIAIRFAPLNNHGRREQIGSTRRCHERSVLANDVRNSFDLRPSEKPLHEGRFERISSKSVRI